MDTGDGPNWAAGARPVHGAAGSASSTARTIRAKRLREADDAIIPAGGALGARRPRPAPLAGARAAVRCLLHGAPRRDDQDRGAALDRGGLALLAAGPAMGAEHLRPHLRRPAAARRAGGRPARAPPGVPGGR